LTISDALRERAFVSGVPALVSHGHWSIGIGSLGVSGGLLPPLLGLAWRWTGIMLVSELGLIAQDLESKSRTSELIIYCCALYVIYNIFLNTQDI
jgi:hypothetical protein